MQFAWRFSRKLPLSCDLARGCCAKHIFLIKIAQNPRVKSPKTHKVEEISPWNFIPGIQARFDTIFGSSVQYRIDAGRT